MSFQVVIPARYGSTRLPGKPLIDLAGKPMIVRVAERALASAAAGVTVATDDARIAAAVEGTGARAVATGADHVSGSDRVMEVADRQGWSSDQIVVNVQGDEPLIPPAVIDQVAALVQDGDCAVGTLCEPIARPQDVFDPAIVKAVADARGCALYFSRAPIPWHRDAFPDPPQLGGDGWKRHIGIYAYRVGALRDFVGWPPGTLEQIESLEQLRFLENGRAIALAEAVEPVPGGVDTPEDAARLRTVLGGAVP